MTFFIGLIMFCLGIAGVYDVGRSKFKRRNFAGMEEFDDYNQAIMTGAREEFVHKVSVFFIIIGLLAMIAGPDIDKQDKAKEQQKTETSEEPSSNSAKNSK